MFSWLKLIRECCFITIFLVLFDPITAFNVDLATSTVYYGSNGSMFGFTVAPYKLNGKSWVLIGAPRNQDEYFSTIEKNYTGGSAYYCEVDPHESQCEAIKFPAYSPNGRDYDYYSQNKDHIEQQGLGVSLATSGSDGAIVVCAPRIYRILGYQSGPISDETCTTGACYYSKKGFTNFAKYSVMNSLDSSEEIRQLGFSTTVSKDSKTLYFGAITVYQENRKIQGYISSLKMDDRRSKTNIKEDPAKSSKSTPYTYFGFSIANLDFYNGQTGVAVASPKAEKFRGKVNIFMSNLNNPESKPLVGEQFAAYFGYSICTADMDGDGADDLIIGAPLYSHNFNSLNQFYENGRIYVYYQGRHSCLQGNSICWDKIFTKSDTIDGKHSKGRFGFAIASIGDINQDGFGDIAVGAPYEENKNHQGALCTGAVYIHHGSKQGVMKTPSQIIKASEVYNLNQIQALSLNSFGSSLSGGLDLDDNLYPDLVVGAHESDAAFLFRSKPIINLTADISFSKQVISLDEHSCKLKDGTKVPCVQLKICLKYDSSAENEIKISTQIFLDHEQLTTSRMFFLNDEKNNIISFSTVLRKNKPDCRNMEAYIAQLKQDEDKLSPIYAKLSCSLITPKNKNKNAPLAGILNSDTESVTKETSLQIANNCGDDNICIPDLRISMKSNVEKFILGPRNPNNLRLNVSVMNKGDDSYRSVFYLKLPQGLGFSYSQPISCPTPNSDNNFTIICKIGNPIPKDEIVNFTLVFEVLDGTQVKNNTFTFQANVTSINSNLNKNPQSNDEKSFNISIVENPNLSITGSSSPIEIFNVSSYTFDYIETDTQAGPLLLHRYVIKNLGFLEITEAIATFYWPQKLNADQNLLYLIAQPITGGSIECDHIENLNYENLKLDQSYNHLLIPDNDAEDDVKTNTSVDGKNTYNAENSDSTPASNEYNKDELTESHLRKRRQVNSKVTNENSCLLGQCIKIQCKIKHLNKNQVASIVFPSVVWAKTFQNDHNKTVRVASYIRVNVTKQAHRVLPSVGMIPSKQVFTNIKLLKIEKSASQGYYWSNVGSAIIGILILAVIMYVMYKKSPTKFIGRRSDSSKLSRIRR
ncbi:integrin alpha-PS2-like isoform X2 [Planococcus citri]|uniref:integrin alpha-PS2-like isoform X2 n=1 Tax=Planococcus citri TaxID=170843 RepID=UPI0031F8D2A0